MVVTGLVCLLVHAVLYCTAHRRVYNSLCTYVRVRIPYAVNVLLVLWELVSVCSLCTCVGATGLVWLCPLPTLHPSSLCVQESECLKEVPVSEMIDVKQVVDVSACVPLSAYTSAGVCG